MPLATLEQLSTIRSTLAEAIETYCKDIGERKWYWSDGNTATLPSFLFPFQTGILVLGIQQTEEMWTLVVGLEDDVPEDTIQSSYDFTVFKQDVVAATSIGFDILGDNVVQIFHTGFTFPDGNATDFFEAYDSTPAKWPVLHGASGDRLLLFALDLDLFLYPQAYQFFDALADLADYVTWYKDSTTED